MADDLVLNPGTGGATLATDQVASGQHYQKIKLVDGTADSTAPIPGSTANGLLVDVSRVQANVMVVAQANSGVDIGDVGINNGTGVGAVPVQGQDAHDVAVSAANPVRVGGRASATVPTAVHDGDAVNAWFDTNGRLHIVVDSGTLTSITNAVHVDVVSMPAVVLGAGTAAIGKLAANSGVDIGDVDVTSLPALPAGDNNIGNVDIVTMPGVTIGAGTAAIGKLVANDGVDVGDVTINNAISSGVYVRPGAGVNLDTSSVTIGTPLPAGANAIGKLAANSGVDIGDVDVMSLPALAAGTNLIGRVSSSDETSTLYNGTTALTPKFATIAASASGNNTIVAAVTGKKIRVVAAQFMANGTVNAKWQSGTGGADLSGLAYLVANVGMVLPYNPKGWFETISGALLNLNLSAAIAVGGSITYVEV